MKLFMIPILAVLASGCTTTAVPVTVPFPSAPAIIMESCEELLKLDPSAKLSNLMITVTENYTRYHECSRKHKAWVEWYHDQKTLFEKAAK